jgi:hypothetical protein
MIPLEFAVSVVWGQSFHYFLGYYATEAEARSAAEFHQRSLDKKKRAKRGAKPHVLVWRIFS